MVRLSSFLSLFVAFSAFADPTFVTIGDSIQVLYSPEIEAQTSCDTVNFSLGGTPCGHWLLDGRLGDIYDSVENVDDGIWFLQCGTNDEAFETVGLEPGTASYESALSEVEYGVHTLISWLRLYKDWPVVMTTYIGWCPDEHQDLIRYVGEDWFTLVDVGSPETVDGCHPSAAGTEEAVATIIEDADVPVCVPEPGMALSMLTGIATLAWVRRRA